MPNCSNCNLSSPDQIKSKGGPVYNELFNELKQYDLLYDKTYFFNGCILYDKLTKNARCSLLLSKDILENTQYFIQIFQKGKPSLIKPFTGNCLQDNRGIISNQNGFTIQYTTIDQSLYFYTTNSNDLMGKFILEDAMMNPPRPLGAKAQPGTYGCGENGYHYCGYCNCGECFIYGSPGYKITTSCSHKVKCEDDKCGQTCQKTYPGYN
jgi:hypothetical protein